MPTISLREWAEKQDPRIFWVAYHAHDELRFKLIKVGRLENLRVAIYEQLGREKATLCAIRSVPFKDTIALDFAQETERVQKAFIRGNFAFSTWRDKGKDLGELHGTTKRMLIKKGLLTESDQLTDLGKQYRQIGLFIYYYEEQERQLWKELRPLT